MGESSQQGAHFKPIVGGRAGYKGVKITFPFCFILYMNENSFPPRFLKLRPDVYCVALSSGWRNVAQLGRTLARTL